MVDVTPTNNQISSDDQELAKVLAGVSPDDPAPEPVLGQAAPKSVPGSGSKSGPEPVAEPDSEPTPAEDPATEEVPATDVDLDTVRTKALQDIKPLLDKLDLPANEKFDIYIEVLRASNDTTLLPPAYDITPNIEDETTRGMDLLTVIREIDSLNQPEA
ncbi:MAG: hypothetical protein LBL84_02325 [Candidatus Nomurabacteria bacterium]|jgi:hypothetical protein|nr:hypothetical protein [Candidatus Nomurabacteria bacterium]